MRSLAYVLSACTALAIGTSAHAAPTSDNAAYPLGTCIVSGEPLVAGAVTSTIEGRELRFCCKDCVAELEKNPADVLSKLDAAIVAAQGGDYPLDTCVVSGRALGQTEATVDHLVGNRLVRLCNRACTGELEKNTTAIIAKLDAATVAAQVDAYPATTCPVGGGALGSMGDPHDHVFAGRLVRFCCAGCIDGFNADPIGALTKVHGAPEEPAVDGTTAGDGHVSHDHEHAGHGH